jgi:large subunit ribosomal protein L1
MKRSKKYLEAKSKVEKSKNYSLDEAVTIVKEVVYSKFDNTIDIFVQLNLKDKQKKESVKGTVVFPNKLGSDVKVAVLAEKADQEKAKKAGADFVGLDDLIKEIENGKSDFDVVIATPDVMAKIAKLGKYIGKKGLMPNPRNGTVTKDVEKAIASFKAGKSSYKMKEGGVFQYKIAKSSMTPDQIKQNLVEFMKSINSEVKKFGDGIYSKISISPTMGPVIHLDLNSVKEKL